MQYTLLMVSVTTLARLRQGDDAFKMGVCSIESCVLLQEKNKGREREDGKKTEKVKRSKYKRWTHTHTQNPKQSTKRNKQKPSEDYSMKITAASSPFLSLQGSLISRVWMESKGMSLATTLQSSLKEDFLLLSCALVFTCVLSSQGLRFFFSTPPSWLGAEYPWAEGKAGKPLESEGGAALLLASGGLGPPLAGCLPGRNCGVAKAVVGRGWAFRPWPWLSAKFLFPEIWRIFEC